MKENTDVNGELYNVEAAEEGPRPFKALLDVGLARTTSGAKVFGALKGAADGGIDVPHNDHRFPGSKREGGEWTTDPAVHRKYIFGLHVSDYMKHLQEDDEESFNRQFKRYIDAGIKPTDFENLYKKAHAAIRADPNKPRDPLLLGRFGKRKKAKTGKETYEHKSYNTPKTTNAERKVRITKVLTEMGKTSIAEHDEEAE